MHIFKRGKSCFAEKPDKSDLTLRLNWAWIGVDPRIESKMEERSDTELETNKQCFQYRKREADLLLIDLGNWDLYDGAQI